MHNPFIYVLHRVECRMFDITKTHAKILEAMVLNQKYEEKKAIGLSLYGLRKIGVAARTFEINKDILLQYQLIRIIKEEKTGLQRRTYYDITPLGFFALLKWFDIKEIQEIFHKKVAKQYLPLIEKHWNELSHMYQTGILFVLKNSIEQIDIVPPSGTVIGPMGKLIEEVMTLPFEMLEIKISFLRKYFTLSKDELSQFKPMIKKLRISNYDRMDIDITKRLTFVFYFNLLRTVHDIIPSMNIAYQIWQYKHPFKIQEDQMKKFARAKKAIVEIGNFTVAYNTTMEKASNTIMKIIKNDPELLNIFKQTLSEIHQKFYQTSSSRLSLPPSLDSLMKKLQVN